jgi:hypothetical protein
MYLNALEPILDFLLMIEITLTKGIRKLQVNADG